MMDKKVLLKSNRTFKSKSSQIRNQKTQGTQKIGFSCTSHLKLKVCNETNNVSVRYFKTHYGHDLQLQHIRIPKSARNDIAAKLVLGVSVPKVVDTIRDSIGQGGDLQRSDLITKKDIYNIKKSFQIDIVDGLRHSDDATSVALWVKECDKNNPVRFFKPQGSDDLEYGLNISDFCLIIMNSFQSDTLTKYASKFVCIDGTHGTNPYDFELTTVLVADEFGEGMPVAFMICNRKDTATYELFFNVIKNSSGSINTLTFMTDITETYYNAWRSVMGDVPNRLFCSWHIDRAWRTNLAKISSATSEQSVHKRKDVYKFLKNVQTCLSVEEFQYQYNNFINYLQEDPDTSHFYNYFTSYYGHNHSLWAYCHRKGLGINTNMYLESMHRIIKYEYLDGKKVKRLDKSLHNLMRFTRDKQVEWIIKVTKGMYRYIMFIILRFSLL
ncbi:hypothetical protein PPYR_14226 [Photinus pyralis]|uniref:MULE transposase domain-containing protein n=1 Tax=Photinus pyralis TaxID=7054 RepID=A0A5N4A4M8_PHOPY|nr:hypothetical protein PPYR_14226 [Photinus pyralis]